MNLKLMKNQKKIHKKTVSKKKSNSGSEDEKLVKRKK